MTSALNRRSIDAAKGLVTETLELQELCRLKDLQSRILEVHTDAGKHVISVGPQIV
jgi:peptide subunit release factor RF-3